MPFLASKMTTMVICWLRYEFCVRHVMWYLKRWYVFKYASHWSDVSWMKAVSREKFTEKRSVIIIVFSFDIESDMKTN